MPWTERLNPKLLKQANDRLSLALIKTREQLAVSERKRAGLEIVLRARLNRISGLNDRLERVRAQNRALDAECERYVQMIQLAPPIDATTPAAKT